MGSSPVASRVLPETTKEEISKNIERAHRVLSKGTVSNGSAPYLVAKMVNWDFSEKVKSVLLYLLLYYWRIKMVDHKSSFLTCV